MTSQRRTDEFDPGADAKIYVGVDLGASTVKANAIHANRDVLLESEVHVGAPRDRGPEEVVEALRAAILKVREILEVEWRDIALIGLTVPCPCRADGSVVEATNLARSPEKKKAWVGVSLTDLLSESLGCDVCPEIYAFNDANAAGVDEHEELARDGKSRTLVLITTGTGLGGCVIGHGEVLLGEGQAGELGHVKVAIPQQYTSRFEQGDPPSCGCGAEDGLCVESRASLMGLTQRLQWALSDDGLQYIDDDLRAGGESLDRDTALRLRKLSLEDAAKDIRSLANEGSAFALWLLDEWSILIGCLFAALAPALHPSRFVIAGGMTDASELVRERFLAKVREVYDHINTQDSFARREGSCEIEWGLGDRGWRGAILMALKARQRNGTDS